jgi:hypothetical protein
MTNRPTRRGLAVGAAALPTSFIIGSAHAQSGPESTLDRVTRTKKLRMAVVSGSPPYFTKDISTGEWTGAGSRNGQEYRRCLERPTGVRRDHLRQLSARRAVQQDRHCLRAEPYTAARIGNRVYTPVYSSAVWMTSRSQASSPKPGTI